MKMNRFARSIRVPAVFFAAALFLAEAGCGDAGQVQNVQSYRQIGLKQLSEGDYESAINAFNKALNERIGVVSNLEEDINFYKAYAQAEAGKTKDAIDTYTALVEYDKKNADAYYLRGCAYISIGEAKRAAEDFGQAVKYKEENGELYAGIYEQLMSAGLSEEAAVYLEEGLKVKGDGAVECLSRGRLYLAGGYYDKAVSEFEAALADGGTEANLYLGETLRVQGRDEDAAAYYEAYAEENPDDSRVLYELGRLAFEEGSYNQALSYFEDGLGCKSVMNKRELWSGKIAVMEYLGDFDAAREEMEEYLVSYPQDSEALREYTFLKTR